MKRYIWLNPVVVSMYGQEQLDEAMGRLGYQIVFCEQDHISRVKARYRETMAENSGCVMDMRCPAAAECAKQIGEGKPELIFPDIEPILIHAARELAGRLDFTEGADLTVITPCSQLRDLGDSKHLSHTRFLTWLDFAGENGLELTRQELKSSPIPPGFFEEFKESGELKHRIACLPSREAIDRFFEAEEYRQNRIAELLYCSHGCHNGNGV